MWCRMRSMGVLFILGCFRKLKDNDFISDSQDDHLGFFSLKEKKKVLGTQLSSW